MVLNDRKDERMALNKKGGLGKGLGKGIDSLISNAYAVETKKKDSAADKKEPETTVKLRLVEPASSQPRLKFDEDRESVKLNTDTIVSVSDIIKTLIDVGAFNKKPSDMDIKTALSNLAKFNIIQKVDGKFEYPETKIIIFPSILFAVTNEKITALSQTISILEENVEDDENEEEEAAK